MKTVEQIMEIVSDYASEIADIASSESVFAHVGKSRYAYRDKTLAELRTAIEELAADAARYRWLRDSEVNQEDQSWIAVGEFDSFGVSAIARDDLDAAIDAAMKKPVVDAEKASKPRYVLRTCEECWGVGESEKYGYDDYSCGFCRDCMGTGKVAILKEST